MSRSLFKRGWFWAGMFAAAALAGFFSLLGLAIADRSNPILESSATVAPWASGMAAIVLAAFTALYVIATQDMARGTTELAKETRKAREAATRPVVVAELEADRSHVFFLVIRNIGNEVAHEFRISCNPDFVTVSGKKLSQLPLFNKGLPTLAPGAYMRTMSRVPGSGVREV